MITEKLLSREFVLITMLGFFTCMNFHTLLSTIPRYSLEVFKLSETQAGVASGLFLVGMMVSRAIAGSMINRIGFQKMMIFGLLGLVVFSFCYFIAYTPIILFFVRFANGFAYGLASTTGITIASTITPRSRSGTGIGYYSMFQIVAWAIGPFLGTRFANAGNYEAIFLLCAILPAVGFVFLPFMRLSGINITDETVSPDSRIQKTNSLNKFFEPRVIMVGLAVAFAGMFLPNITGFLPVYAKMIGLEEVSSYYFVVYAGCVIVTRPFVSRMFDKKGANLLFYPGVVIMSLGFFITSQIQHEYASMVLIAAAVLGVGFGAVQNATLGCVQSVERERLGVANATYFLILDTSAAVAPILGGALIEVFNYQAMFMTGSFFAIAAMILYWRKVANVFDRSRTSG